jgi:hypothetical protein
MTLPPLLSSKIIKLLTHHCNFKIIQPILLFIAKLIPFIYKIKNPVCWATGFNVYNRKDILFIPVLLSALNPDKGVSWEACVSRKYKSTCKDSLSSYLLNKKPEPVQVRVLNILKGI